MKIELKINPPLMPNFFSYESQAGKRQDGIQVEGSKIDVAELTEEQAKEFSELMKNTFMEHWKQRKLNQDNHNKV